MRTKITFITYTIHELIDYINWTAWLANFPASDIPKATEAMQLHKEAMCMLNTMEQTCNVKAVFKLMDANADGDDLILDGKKLPLLRQQTRVHDSDPYLCLSDFVRPLSQGIPDTVGGFATTIDETLEKRFEYDPYKHLLIQTLNERLAEAAANKLHEMIRKEVWGYAKDEHLTRQQLLNEEYQGIRPAVGYPSLPDLSVIFLLDELIDIKSIGIRLTENGMMQPHASVCGLMFSHPQARYFAVGKIDEHQLADYAARRGKEVSYIQNYLTMNLQY